MGRAGFDHHEVVLNQSCESCSGEVVQVLRINIAIASPEQTYRQRLHVRRQHETTALRFQQAPGLFQEKFRFQQVLQHRPKGDRVELFSAEILLQKIAANHRDAARLCVFQRRPANICSQYLIAPRKTFLQLEQKRAR